MLKTPAIGVLVSALLETAPTRGGIVYRPSARLLDQLDAVAALLTGHCVFCKSFGFHQRGDCEFCRGEF